jgi:hypothetical protein
VILSIFGVLGTRLKVCLALLFGGSSSLLLMLLLPSVCSMVGCTLSIIVVCNFAFLCSGSFSSPVVTNFGMDIVVVKLGVGRHVALKVANELCLAGWQGGSQSP